MFVKLSFSKKKKKDIRYTLADHLLYDEKYILFLDRRKNKNKRRVVSCSTPVLASYQTLCP